MDLSSLSEVTTLYGLSFYAFIFLTIVTSTLFRRGLGRSPTQSLRRALRQILPPLLVNLCSTPLQVRKYVLFSWDGSTLRFLRQNGFVQPWTLQEVVVFLVYLGGNVTCVIVKSPSLPASGLRAGRLALINMLVLYAGPHLSFLADVARLPLSAYKRIHICVSFNVLILALFHFFASFWQRNPFPLSVPSNKFALVSVLSLAFESILLPLLRRLIWYELSLRLHQLNAILLAVAMYLHIPADQKIYVYVIASVFSATCAFQIMQSLFRHRFKSFPAHICQRKSHWNEVDTVELVLNVERLPLKVQAGQYINIWMPHVSTLSSLQTHPFTVVSWSEKPQRTLKLVVCPQNGWTRRLLEMVLNTESATTPAMFTGPHGVPLSTYGYNSVLIFAQKQGIFPCLPLLRQIIDDHIRKRSPMKRVHLAFEDATFDLSLDIQDTINECLRLTFTDKTFTVGLYGTAVFRVTKPKENKTGDEKESVDSDRKKFWDGHLYMMSPEERRAMEKMTAKATTTAEETTSAKDTTTAMEKILDEEFPLPPSEGVRSSGVNTLILTSLTPFYQDAMNRFLNRRMKYNFSVVDIEG